MMDDITKQQCLCASLRKATRVITKRYDEHLKPSGLRITQYSMLANIGRNPGVTVSELANILVMDQTTVSRNLQVLNKLGYIDIQESDNDQRVRIVHISDLGKKIFDQAKLLWTKVQSEVETELGKLGFEVFLQSLSAVANK